MACCKAFSACDSGTARPRAGGREVSGAALPMAPRMSRLAGCAIALTLGLSLSLAHAQSDYPNKPVRLLIGFPAGSTADIIARNLVTPLSGALGQPLVVDNRAGAGSSIAAEVVARAAPDGYTLLLSTIANTINPSLYHLSFDFTHDLAGVAMLAESNALLIASLDSPRSISDLLRQAKTRPNEFQFGSSGNGTFTHLYGELLNLSASISLGHVPYRGSTQVLTDIMAGRLALGFITAAPVLPSVKANRVRALATTGTQRSGALPDVPTFAESGINGFEAGLWFGLNTTAGTPRAVIDRLNRDVQKAMQSTEMREVLANQGIESKPTSAAAFDQFIAQDTAKWERVVKAAGVKVE